MVDASTGSLDDTWYIDTEKFGINTSPYSSYNVYERGGYGQWRNERSFLYKTDLSGLDGNNANARNYNSGIYANFELFNFDEPDVNEPEKWLPMNKVTHYSPFSFAEQEKNILGIYNASRIGYNHSVPYAVGLNTQKWLVQFESFENTYNIGGSDYYEEELEVFNDGSVDNSVAHTGQSSFLIDRVNTNVYLLLNEFYENAYFDSIPPIGDNGMLLRMWVKQEKYGTGLDEFNLANRFKAGLQEGSDTTWADFEVLIQTGEWELLEARLTDFSPFGIYDAITPIIRFKRPLFPFNSIDVWIDDIRFHPFDASVQCFVYDTEKLNMIASFDDQHIATFFHYDGEGKLVRKSVETERGCRTIEETFYHTKTQDR